MYDEAAQLSGQQLTHLSFCKHTDIGGGFRGIIIFAICDDGAIKEGQIVTGGVMQLHLQDKEEKRKHSTLKSEIFYDVLKQMSENQNYKVQV